MSKSLSPEAWACRWDKYYTDYTVMNLKTINWKVKCYNFTDENVQGETL